MAHDISLLVRTALDLTTSLQENQRASEHVNTWKMQSAKSGLCQMLRAHDILYSAKNCKEQAVTHEEPRD